MLNTRNSTPNLDATSLFQQLGEAFLFFRIVLHTLTRISKVLH
jgi:hypothetical protein